MSRDKRKKNESLVNEQSLTLVLITIRATIRFDALESSSFRQRDVKLCIFFLPHHATFLRYPPHPTPPLRSADRPLPSVYLLTARLLQYHSGTVQISSVRIQMHDQELLGPWHLRAYMPVLALQIKPLLLLLPRFKRWWSVLRDAHSIRKVTRAPMSVVAYLECNLHDLGFHWLPAWHLAVDA